MGRKRKHGKDLPGRMYTSHGAYYLVDRNSKWHHLGRDYAKAMAKYGELTENPVPMFTMNGLMDRYMKEVAPKKALRTYKNNLNEIRKLRKVFGRMRPRDVTPQDIYAYMDARNAPVAANREKALLSDVFNYAIRWGVVSDNPCRRVKRNPARPRTRYVEDKEYKAVWDIAPPMIQCAMDLGYLTGLRLGDLLKLTRDNVRKDGLYVITGKTGTKQLFERTPELENVLGRCKALRGKVSSLKLLICTRDGQRYALDGFKSMWQRLMRKAVDKNVIKERFTFNDLRAKAASDADNPTELLGHDDPKTTNRVYRRGPRRVTPLRPKILGNR